MEGDQLPSSQQCLYYGCMASPSWFPTVGRNGRFEMVGRDATEKGRKWRGMLKRIVKEGRRKGLSFLLDAHSCGSTNNNGFGYDPADYLKNFDDGCLQNDRLKYCLQDHHGWQENRRTLA